VSNKTEKQRRKELRDAMRIQEQDNFENNLPMEKEKFKTLFDYLDEALPENNCDDTNRLTKKYLEGIKQENIESVLEWLANHGGYCDCEILGNVEELFI
jgi:hypothetical protein